MSSNDGNDHTGSDPASASASGWTSSLKSWRSIIPGYGSKANEDNAMPDPDPSSHQITDYQEGERRDVDGNIVQLAEAQRQPPPEPKQQQQQPGQMAIVTDQGQQIKNTPQPLRANRLSEPYPSTTSSASNPLQTATVAPELPGSKAEEAANKAVTTVSKAVMKRKKNVILPDYYEQFSDVLPSLFLTVPVGSGDLTMLAPGRTAAVAAAMDGSLSGRVTSMMRYAVSSVRSLFSPSGAVNPATSKKDPLKRGAHGIRKVAIIGVHGWFPRKTLRAVIGEPTGTSRKFCEEMDLALKDYLETHGKHLETEDVTLIPLDGEGKVLDRVEMLHQSLMSNQKWKRALHEADLVLVATHSQGTPTSILLLARLIHEGLLRVQEDDPRMQRIGMLAMAGISHGPFPFLKGNFVLRWFEREAAQELFEFMDSESSIAKKYRQGLRTVLSSGVRLTCVASLEDQVVPLYSAVMTSIHHPSIVRAVYIDGASFQNDFLINLIAFLLRLRNSGVDDHGILVHLSEVIAGSLYGEGHSTIYEERDVYMLSIRSLLEPPASLTPEMVRSEPVLNPFRAKQRLNPFYLPWGMRGIADEIMARGDQILINELERLKRLYNEWNPITKGMKEIKFRLEPVRSKL